jgi:hypothetical protein
MMKKATSAAAAAVFSPVNMHKQRSIKSCRGIATWPNRDRRVSTLEVRPLLTILRYLEVERADAPKRVEVLPVGSGLADVPVGSRLVMVAASEDGTASDQEGTLLVRNAQLQTNINVARNSKAAPVLDSRGRVVAVHASNSEAGTLSFETPVRSFFFLSPASFARP